MKSRRILILITFALLIIGLPGPARAQDETGMIEFSILMDDLVDKIVIIENAYSLSLTGSIARTRRLEAYTDLIPEIESIGTAAEGRSDKNSLLLEMLIDVASLMDPLNDDFMPVLEELWVRSVVLRCETRGIGPEIVKDYIRRESSGFVANRGNFSHPEFDQAALNVEDQVNIFFTGFGLIVLVHMDGGLDYAIEIYEDATDLKGYFTNQLMFRAVDLDVDGLPVLERILRDSEGTPIVTELLYGMIAGKLLGPAGQFGNELTLTVEWKSTIADWTFDYITIPDRLEARLEVPFYGVDFEYGDLIAEALLGLLGPIGKPKILELLSSEDLMRNVIGLESLRWFDIDRYPDDAAELFETAEPLMAKTDFTLAVLAKEAFDADTYYIGEPYDETRRARIAANIPHLCDLMRRAYEHEAIEYIASTAWLDIYQEGSLVDLLVDCMPMVAQVVNSDFLAKQENPDISLPEGEVKLITYFIPLDNLVLFTSTEEAVLGFLLDELDGDEINPFRIWTYVDYLNAWVDSGGEISDEWLNALIRIRAWTNSGASLIQGDELKSRLDEMMF